MIFFDYEYIVDTQYKIDYNNLVEVDKTDYSSTLFNVNKLYLSNNVVLLAYTADNFYTKNVYFCKEIGENIYKIIINDPSINTRSMTRISKNQIKNNKII